MSFTPVLALVGRQELMQCRYYERRKLQLVRNLLQCLEIASSVDFCSQHHSPFPKFLSCNLQQLHDAAV